MQDACKRFITACTYLQLQLQDNKSQESSRGRFLRPYYEQGTKWGEERVKAPSGGPQVARMAAGGRWCAHAVAGEERRDGRKGKQAMREVAEVMVCEGESCAVVSRQR